MTPNPLDNIPADLRQHRAWLLWRYEPNPDPAKSKPLKVPYYVSGRRRAGAQGSEPDRRALATLVQARAALDASGGHYTGLGFAMLPDWGLVGLDFDACVDAAGTVLPEVARVVGSTYAEVSPSGRGVRAFMLGSLPDRKSHASAGGHAFGFEVFHSKGFLTITGAVTDAYDLAGTGVEPLAGTGAAPGSANPVLALVESRFGAGAHTVRPPRPAGTGLQNILDLGVLSAALQVIATAVNTGKQEMGRNTWRDVLYGIHEATGGSDAGLATAHWFSQSVPDYGPEALDIIWDGADCGKGGGITGASVRHMARRHGWADPTLAPTVDAFDVIPFDTRPAVPVGRSGDGPRGVGACAPAEVGNPVAEGSRRAGREQSLTSTGAGETAALVERPGDVGDLDLPMELPLFDRKKSGAILPIFENCVLALERPDLTGWDMKCDTFRDDVMVLPPGAADWRPWKAADVGELRVKLKNCGFESCGKDIVRDALVLAAARREYDSAQEWLAGLEPLWDGVHRCESFLVDHWGAVDSPYVRAVGRYMWTALAGRVITPGCQADMAVVLEGDQGLRKTSGIAALVPDYRLFAEVDLTKDDTDLARIMRGALVCEISELRGLHTRDQESIKGFVTRRHEKWIPKYVEQSTIYPRRAVLFGTTNRTDILADETGNRRWLPLHVERVDVESIELLREQLWAEAAALYRAGGVDWKDAEALAPAEHEQYMISDSWEDPIVTWIDEFTVPRADGEQSGGVEEVFTVDQILSVALGLPRRDAGMAQQRRVGAILRKLGFVKRRARTSGGLVNGWARARDHK